MKLNKSKFRSSEELFEKHVGPKGSAERADMEVSATKWFYGSILKQKRKDLKMTQGELAELVGVKQSYISRLERGEEDVRISSLIPIANTLGLELKLS